ncbi:MAG: hypothetical protein EB127_18310 [Alphaproteobacteria bacterium]|nr:hypothetical protein [Alphaproteobacteria bacterium]
MSKNTSKSEVMVVKPSEFDVKHLSFTIATKKPNDSSNVVAYPSYKGERFVMKFPKIVISHYGIPNDDQYHKTPESREFCQLPLDPSIEANEDFIESLKAIDDYMRTSEFKKKYLGDKGDKFELSPCIHTPDVKPGEKTASGKPKINIPSLKIRFSKNYETNKIDCEFYKSTMVDGAKTNVLIEDTDDIDSIKKKALPYKSEVVFIGIATKMWSMPGTKKYGLSWKAIKALVELPSGSSFDASKITINDFLDSDDDVKVVKVSKPMAKLAADEDDDDDEEEEKEEEKKPETKPSKKTQKFESDEEEEVVVKPSTKVETKITKKVQQIESDDDDDDDEEEEEEAPVVKPTKQTKPVKKVVVEEEEEEEEVVEKPKPTKKAAPKGKGKSANA